MRRTKIRNDSPIQKNKKNLEEKTASQNAAQELEKLMFPL
jgi:hypothetical protein